MTAATAYAFFLGGHDLEMVAIAALLRDRQRAGDARVAQVHDLCLTWGATASAYAAGIAAAGAAGLVPVLVELTADLPLRQSAVEVDHHGARTAEPASLRQVFDLLALPQSDWTREMALIVANDTGHVPALRRVGATDAEICTIRARDRAAQGITPEDDASGALALQAMQAALDGSLLIVDLPHDRSATVTDPLALAGDTRDLLVLCPASTQFFGDGTRLLRLDATFTGGWRGGELPRRGFWGLARRLDLSEALAALAQVPDTLR